MNNKWELLKLLNEGMCDYFAPLVDDCGTHLVDHLLANGVTVQKWIPVTERLPEDYRNKYGKLIPFLVCMDYADYPFRAVYDGENWSDGICTIPVTWWMPLPELPRE